MKTQTLTPLLPRSGSIGLALALVSLFVAAPLGAVAQESAARVETKSTGVSLAGIDLSTPQGMRDAYARVNEAAKRVCAQVSDHLDLGHQAHFVKCVDETTTTAMSQVQRLAR